MADRTFPLSTPARVDNDYPFGFCPKCGCHGASREHLFSIAMDVCAMGHTYPSHTALMQRPTDLRTLIQHRIERYKATRPSLNTVVEYDQGIASTLEWIESDLKLCLVDSDSHNDPQAHETRIALLETEVRRLNNAARHLRAKLREALEGEG